LQSALKVCGKDVGVVGVQAESVMNCYC
jgi:hypothetical protein